MTACPLQCGFEGELIAREAATVTIFVCPECLGVAFDGAVLRDPRRKIDLMELIRAIVLDVDRSSSLDPLTQVKNRQFFFRRLAAEMRSTSRPDSVHVAAFAFDLDELHAIAGSRGGDAVLRTYAAAFLDAIRTGDNFARVEPNVFGLIIAGVEELRALTIVDRILAKVRLREYRARIERSVWLNYKVALTTAHVDEYPEQVWLRILNLISKDKKNDPHS